MEFTADADTFWALPRHPDWRYEHLGGRAHLSYRPRPLELVRDLSPVTPRGGRRPAGAVDGLAVAPPAAGDEAELVALVATVWEDLDPYRSWAASPGAGSSCSAGERFAQTLAGADDPWGPGVLVARLDRGAGAAIGVVALHAWPPLRDRRAPAEPALSWLTVASPWHSSGVATALLAASVEVALDAGAGELHSSVSCANLPSISWHWVNGFQPLVRRR